MQMFSVHQKVFFKKHTEKVAVNTVVGLLYKVLKNCLLQACDVFDVKMIQIWTFPAAPSTKRVPSLAERVDYLRYSINLRLFDWRVPVLQIKQAISILLKINIRCSDEDTNLSWGEFKRYLGNSGNFWLLFSSLLADQ